MNKKIQIFIFCCSVLILQSCSAKQNPVEDCNMQTLQSVIDSIALEVLLVQSNETAPYSTIYRVEEWNPEELISEPYPEDFFTSKPKKRLDKEHFKSVKKKCWMSLLNHHEYNWETNLFLYHIFEKDAVILIGMKPDEWKEHYKEVEIKYWQVYFDRRE